MGDHYNTLKDRYAAKPEGYYDLARPEMLQFVQEAAKFVLEVGCSSGAFGALLKEERPNCEVWGIEPDLESARVAASRLDKVVQGTFSSEVPGLNGKRFDVVCFFDVLEHLANP